MNNMDGQNIYKTIKETFEVIKPDGKVIRGIIFRPDFEGGIFPAVIFSHGFGGNYRELQHHGPGYAEAGIVCVLFDFCGGGMGSVSDGYMQDMTVLTEAEDLENVLKTVRKFSYVDETAVYLQGESQGGLVSAIVGSRREADTKGLILWYPAFVIPDDAKKRNENGETAVFGVELSPDYDKAAMTIDIEEIQRSYNKPVLLIHGDKDDLVPISYSRNALSTYRHARLEEIKGAGHGFDGDDSKRAGRLSVEFMII